MLLVRCFSNKGMCGGILREAKQSRPLPLRVPQVLLFLVHRLLHLTNCFQAAPVVLAVLVDLAVLVVLVVLGRHL